MTRNKLMVDIETLGTKPGAVILSIGAVRFDNDGIGDEFYEEIDIVDAQDAGLTIEAETLSWWLGQSSEAQDVLTSGIPLELALNAFEEFADPVDEVWAKSPRFDCALLRAAFDTIEKDVPWSFRDERDVRTLTNLPVPTDVSDDGTKHNALDDARYQAKLVSSLQNKIREMSSELSAYDTQ